MKGTTFVFSFPDVSRDDGNRLAADFLAATRDLDSGLVVNQRRDRGDTLDFGATVVLILGTASVTAVSHGIAAWLARHSGAKIRIEADGCIVASNLDSRDASRIAEALSRHKTSK